MNSEKECPFCTDKEVMERIIVKNDLAFAFPTLTPIVPAHVLICPKRHVKYYDDLTSEEKVAIEELRTQIQKALINAFQAEGFNYAWNEEKIGGQSVPHFHLHVLPRRAGDTGTYNYEPREFLYRPGPREVPTPNAELLEIVAKIQKSI